MDNLSKILKTRRKELGLTLAQIADKLGVTEATVQRWESGNIKSVRYEKIEILSNVLKISPSVLMGWEDALPPNVVPFPRPNTVPLIGDIACGTPILAEQNVEDYVDLPRHIHADYALTCHGESMIGAGIHDGDVVYIRAEEDVIDGQIAAVMVGDEEATLKRLYHDADGVTLVAENPAFPPKHFSGTAAADIRVLGLAVAFTHPLV